MLEEARELCEEMLDALDSCLLQMQVAGLGYATRTLAIQIQGFQERIQSMDGREPVKAADREDGEMT